MTTTVKQKYALTERVLSIWISTTRMM